MHASMRCYFERYFPSSRPTEKLCSHPSKHVYWYPWSQRKGPSNAAPRDRSSTWATGSTRWSGRYPCSEPDSLHEKRTVSYISMGLGTPRQHLEFSEFFQGDVPNNWRRFSSSSEWIYGLDLFSAMVWYFRQLTWPTNLSHRTITWCELTIDFQAATHTHLFNIKWKSSWTFSPVPMSIWNHSWDPPRLDQHARFGAPCPGARSYPHLGR